MSETDNFSHRAGYHADPLAVAIRQAREGGTLAAGEGALLVAEIDRLHAERERVRALHVDAYNSYVRSVCKECGIDYPCPTIRALDGDA